jgi:hypothetical protein
MQISEAEWAVAKIGVPNMEKMDVKTTLKLPKSAEKKTGKWVSVQLPIRRGVCCNVS